jgi:hypothetical protein
MRQLRDMGEPAENDVTDRRSVLEIESWIEAGRDT